MLVCIPGKVATVATVVTLRRSRHRTFLYASYSLNFQSLPRKFPVFLPPPCPVLVYHYILFTDSWISHADPRGPNFAEIHARGRRGRLEFDHRDLIPPWGHRLLHGEERKPSMAVWLDCNRGALPSWLTRMVDKGN